MPARIFIIISNLDIGGAEKHLLQIMPYLDRSRFAVTIYTTYQKGTLASQLEAQGVTVIAPKGVFLFSRLGWFGKWLRYLVSLLTLTGLMLVKRPKIVHCFLAGPYLMGGICALLTRRPYIMMSRRSLNFYQKKYPLLARLEHWLHKKMDVVLGNSQAVIAQLQEEGVPPSKLKLIYNGIDLIPFESPENSVELRKELDISENALMLIIVANLHLYKGHRDLLEALALIKEKMPADWVLVCVGRSMGQLEKLKALSIELGIEQHIRWLGERQDIVSLLSAAQIGLLCSHHEGFSNSILEGMAAGLPMVVTDVGGNAEAVVDGQTGLVVPAKNPRALAQALSQLISNPQLRNAMGEAGKQRMQQYFSRQHCVKQYEALYAHPIWQNEYA